MPGSKKYFAYFTDDGMEFFIQQDESAAESLALGFGQSITPAVAADPCKRLVPQNKFPLEPRYVLVNRVDADGRAVRRKYIVGAESATAWLGTPYGIVIDGETWDVTARVGEIRHYIPSSDTGQIDGDVDDNIGAAT